MSIKQSRHPLATKNRRELSTFAIVNRAIERASPEELETVAVNLKAAIDQGKLNAPGREALDRVNQALARKRVEALFISRAA